MGGAFAGGCGRTSVRDAGGARKSWKSWQGQVDLLRERGLDIDDDAALRVLGQVSYYRLSGYARYFQQGAELGGNDFIPGSKFVSIKEIYDLDERIREIVSARLAKVEVLLRSQYAYAMGESTDPYEGFLDEGSFVSAGEGPSVVEACRRDLDRSKEPFIVHFRRAGDVDPYRDMPVWAAVEAFSFGTLSKCIERARGDAVIDQINQSTKVTKEGLASRIRAFVYLRNRCAHHARLWNHSVLDAGATPNNVRRKAKRRFGNFEPRSVMDVLVSLDDFLSRSGLEDGFLDVVEKELNDSRLYRNGLLWPRAAENREDKPGATGHPHPNGG